MSGSMHERIRARRRAVARQAYRRRRQASASVAALVILVLGGYALTYVPLFAVDDVRVVGVSGDEAAAVRDAVPVHTGERLFGVSLEGISARVQEIAWVRDAQARRVPPSTVEVHVTRRDPVAAVVVADAAWLVDRDGVVVAGGRDPRLVEIHAPNSVLPGVGAQVHDSAVRNALKVHEELPGPLRTNVLRYEAPSVRDLRLLLDSGQPVEGIWVRFGLAERVDAKAQTVGLLLQQLREQSGFATRDGLSIAEIDVRAPGNPVLVPTE